MYSGLKSAMKGKNTTEDVQSTNAKKKQRDNNAVLCSCPNTVDVLSSCHKSKAISRLYVLTVLAVSVLCSCPNTVDVLSS